MTLSDLASLGSFVSGAAVLVSLIFLYFQLRQVTAQISQAEKNQQAVIKQGRAIRLMEINARGTEASFAEVAMKVHRNAQDLTSLDCYRYASHARAVFQNAEESFSQYRRGLLDDRDFDAYVTSISWGLRSPGLRVGWKKHRAIFPTEFVDFMDKLLDKAPVTLRPSDIVAEWRADLAAEMAKAT